jgi:hypothetical protein
VLDTDNNIVGLHFAHGRHKGDPITLGVMMPIEVVSEALGLTFTDVRDKRNSIGTNEQSPWLLDPRREHAHRRNII